MKRHIFINRYFYPDHSPTSQLLTDLAFALSTEAEEVFVITSRQRYDDSAARLAGKEAVNGVNIRRVWTSRYGRSGLKGRAVDYITFYLSAAWELALLTRRGDVVIAKTDPPLISVVAAVIAKLRGAALINWVQDMFPEVASELGIKGIRKFESLLRRIRNISLKQAVVNVALGDRMADRIISQGINPDRVAVIHNWSESYANVSHSDDPGAMRAKWGLERKFVVGYSGNMGRAHEFGTVIDAATLLRGNDDIRFLFVGGGAGLELIQKEVSARGLANVLFKPYQAREHLATSLRVPDVHLISLRPELEGLIVPSKFYGVAAAGRPALYIGDEDGEIARVLKESKCGLAVRAGDAAGLARIIDSMSHDRDELVRMGERASEVFGKKFHRTLAIERWKDIIRAT